MYLMVGRVPLNKKDVLKPAQWSFTDSLC
jgi:hypothetical protein